MLRFSVIFTDSGFREIVFGVKGLRNGGMSRSGIDLPPFSEGCFQVTCFLQISHLFGAGRAVQGSSVSSDLRCFLERKGGGCKSWAWIGEKG